MCQDGAQEVPKCSQDEHLASMLGAFGIDFSHFRGFGDVRVHIKKHGKTFGFWRFFEGLGSTMAAKAKKIW